MQSGESSETLGVEAYRVVPLGDASVSKVECLTTHDDLLFVGTTDSKIAFYRVSNNCGGSGGGSTASPSVKLLHEVLDPRRQPVRAITTVGDQHLLALLNDTIVLYCFCSDPARPLQMREVTTIGGLKDTISFHVKQQRGVLSLAALQRRRLTVYEASFAHLEFLLKETVALPDGVRTFGWMGRSLLLGGRKEYFFYHTSSATTTALYPTPRSGAAPLVLPMAPIPEVLVAGEGGGMRALLSDGSEVPGDSRVSWASPPASMIYEHPYVVSHHPSSPHTLQVRLPLLTTLAVSPTIKSGLLQFIDIPKLARVSQCCWTDYDCPMPTNTTAPHALTRHPIVVADASGRLFSLARTSMATQAEHLAGRKLFAAADLLCQLCPHQVHIDTLRRVVTAGAMHRFLALKDYAGCFHDLNKIEADPRLAIQLFPGFVRHEDAASCPPLPVPPPATVPEAALPALADYLQSRRTALLLQGPTVVSTAAARTSLACVDRALVLSWCAMKAEPPLLVLLQSENWCAAKETAALLEKNGQWVALVVLLEAHKEYDAAANHLRRLVGIAEDAKGVREAPLKEFVPLVSRFLHEYSAQLTGEETYVSQEMMHKWAAQPDATGHAPTAAALNALVGFVTALTFFRRRVLPAQQRLFAQHLTWLLGCVPPDKGLRVFFSNTNVLEYPASLRLLHGYVEQPGSNSRQLLIVSFLYLLFNDARVHVTDDALYDQYWRGLGDLLFAAPPSTLGEEAYQCYRGRLDEFLRTATQVDLDAARRYFNAAALKGKCVPERALVYRRQGAHRSAIEMFLVEADDMAGAKAYASSVRSEDDGDAFTALLELLLRPSHGDPRVKEALSIMNTCDGVNAALVLPMLPDTMPFAQLSGFLLNAFRDAATTYHMAAIDSSVLRAKVLQAEETHVRERARSAVLQDAAVCAACHRRIRPDTVLAVYPDGLLVHQGCVKDEHVSPTTLQDYRYAAYSLLEEL